MHKIKQTKHTKQQIMFILFCILFSFIALLFCSKCSFLYEFNDWVDANSFFTTGKGLMNGKVIYQELFEQKGPTLYLIYGIGYLLSHATFMGIFLLEILSFSIFLYFIGKISDLFLERKYKYLVIPLISVIILTNRAFVQGGSAEEFCLPLFAISLYYFIGYLKNHNLPYKQLFINGLIAGLILTIKFTLLGFWFGFMLVVMIALLSNKKIKEMIYSALIFLCGMAIPMLLWVLYFLIHHALGDFIEAYFILNLTAYGVSQVSIYQQVLNCFIIFFEQILQSGLVPFLILLLSLLFIDNKLLKINKFYMMISILFSILFVYIGGRYFNYYLLLLLPWLSLGVIEFISRIEKPIKMIKTTKLAFPLYIIFVILCLGCCYLGANFKSDIKLKKEEDYHYSFAKIINRYPEKQRTLLNYGALDFGLYTSANIIPNVKYFHMLNIPYEKYPYIVNAHNEYIKNQVTEFVLYRTFPNEKIDKGLLTYYEVIAQKNQVFEGNEFTYSLLKKIY